MILGCLFGLSCHVTAQTTAECKTLLKRNISLDDPEQILQKFTTLKCFGLDSVDLKVFGNGPVLGVMLVKLVQNSGHQKSTYGDLLNEINKRKADTTYPKLRDEVIAMNTLEAMKATSDSWERGAKLLREIDMHSGDTAQIHLFLLKNLEKNWNYRQLVTFYEQSERDSTAIRSNVDQADSLRTYYARYCDTTRLTAFGENLVAFKNYSYGLACALKMHRPVLIFFGASHSVNSRRLQSIMTYNPSVDMYLQAHFIIVDLKVDDKARRPKSTKSVGEINNDFETQKYKTNYQPYLVIVDERGNFKRSTGFVTDYDLLSFLNKPD